MLQTLQHRDQGAPRERLAGPPDIKDPLKFFRMSAAEGAGTQFRWASLRFHETGQWLETEHESGRQDQGAHLPSIAVGKLGACISLMSIGPDTCLRLSKEAFDWKQGAPSGTVLLPLQTYEGDNQLHLERLGFQIGCIGWCFYSMINAAGFGGELASGDVTSGHPPSPCMV